MQTRQAFMVATLLAACGTGTGNAGGSLADGEAVLPDTQTVDGVLQMRHPVDALGRAPQLALDTASGIIFDGGDNLEFDLTKAVSAVLYSDGRALVSVSGTASRILEFNADGTPGRVIASNGAGPGEVRVPLGPIRIAPDTMLLVDTGNRRVNFVTADSGIVHAISMASGGMPFCYIPATVLPGQRLVVASQCPSPPGDDYVGHLPVPMIALSFDYSGVDTLAIIGGLDIAQAAIEGNKESVPLRLGSEQAVAGWAELLAASSTTPGFRIEQHSADGELIGNLVVEGPRRAVTPEMNQAGIKKELEQAAGAQLPPGFIERLTKVLESFPVADSLPGFGKYFGDTDGVLWALKFVSPIDSSWSAIAFRKDGAIMGTLSVPLTFGEPIWFGDGKVVLRSTDDDGFVRFGAYGVGKR